MKILIDISHPAHVHFFRNVIRIWQERNHSIILTARDKDITLPLLDEYGYEYKCLSKVRRGVPGFIYELLEHEFHLFQIISHHKPDALIEIGGTFIVHVAKLMRIPSLVFYDTEHARLSNTITYPFADAIITPDCYCNDLGHKHVRYRGYHELAYLHPKRYRPDHKILDEIGVSPGEPYFLLRFVSWEACHDMGHCGLGIEGKHKLVKELQRLGRVIITSESPLPPELEPFRLGLSPTKIHDLLYYCTLYIGEGATLASEAAMLGIPSIYISCLTAGTLEEQEKKYGLLHRVHDEDQAIDLAVQLAQGKNTRDEYQQRRQRMLAEKIDVTAWVADFVEEYIGKKHVKASKQEWKGR